MKAQQMKKEKSCLINQNEQFIEHINNGDVILAFGNYEEAEKFYAEAFYIALKSNYIEKQAEALKKLGDIYYLKAQQKERNVYSINYNKAIALYNAALIKSENENDKNELIREIKKTERSFLQSIKVTDKLEVSSHESDIEHQTKLIKIRTEKNETINFYKIQKNINDNQIVFKIENIQNIYFDITKEIKNLILKLIYECKILLRNPPCNYAIVALGSLAREEMTPYSDFEWAILIENKRTKRNKRSEKYFRNLTNLLHIKVLNLGETILPSMEIDSLKNYYNATSIRGFCFDGLMSHACKWPLGNMHLNIEESNKFKLIGTPEEIVSKYINKESFDKNRGLFSVLSNTKLIEGDGQLYQNFIAKRQIAFEQIVINEIGETAKLREYAALAFLRANVISYLPKVGKLIEDPQKGLKRVYPVKNDLYRLPHLVLDGLALYYDLNSASSWDRINELSDLRSQDGSVLFNEETIKYFRESFDEIASLRLTHYLKENSQRDEIKLESDIENAMMLKLYEFHIYLNDVAYDFALNGKNSFNSLPNEHHLAKIRVLEKLGRYDEVEIECKTNKDRQDLDLGTKLNILNRLGLAQFYLGKEQEAYRTLDGCRQIAPLNQHTPFDCIMLHNLALALSNMGKYTEALGSINSAISIIENKTKLEKIKSLYKIKAFDYYPFYQEKASILLRLGKLKEARESLAKADKEVEEYYKYGKNGEYWNFQVDLAQVYAEFGNIESINFKQANNLYDKAIKGLSNCLGEMHSSVASALSRKAQLLMHEAKHQEALEHYEQALFIYHQNGKDYHSIEIAKCLSDKSLCYVWQGEYELAIKYINKAIKLFEEKEVKLGLNPRLKAIGLTNLAKISQEIFLKKIREEKISNSKEAADEINLVFKQYADIFKVLAQENCGAESVDLAFILTNLANFLLDLEGLLYPMNNEFKQNFHLNKEKLRKLCGKWADIGIKFIDNHIIKNGESVRAIDTYGGILNAKASILAKICNPKEPVVNFFLKAKQKLQEFFPDNQNINLIIANSNIGKIYYNDAIHYKLTQPSKSEKYKTLAAKYFLLSLQWSSNSESFIKQKPIIYFELAKLLRDFGLTSEAKHYANLALENETYLTLSLTENDRRKLIEIKGYKNQSKLQLKNWFNPIKEEFTREGSFQDLNIQETNLAKLSEELKRQWNKLIDNMALEPEITHPTLLEIHNNIQHILKKKESSQYTTFNPNENILEGSIMERKQQVDEALHLLDKQESKHDEVFDINIGATGEQLSSKFEENLYRIMELSKAGAMMTGDQLATLLQTIKESSGAEDRIEFTPTITIATLDAFIQRVLSSESIKKVQFGVINVVSEGKSKQILIPAQQDQMPGEHWVSYIQVPNLFDEEGKVTSVISILLNSAGENYDASLTEINNRIEDIFTLHKIQITLPIKHLDYQKQDFDQHQDWNTCGIWTCNFFEQTIEKIIKAENAADINFKDLTEYVNINQKRQEYADLLQALDISTNPITKANIGLEIDKVLDIESTEIDSILEEIDKELSEKYGINTEELDLDKLLSNEYSNENISPNNILSPVLNTKEAKELIQIIKDKANPPILEEETDLAKGQRLALLAKAFIDLAKLYIDKADAYDDEKIKQTKMQYYTEAIKLLNYALSINKNITDKAFLSGSSTIEQMHSEIVCKLEQIYLKVIGLVGINVNQAEITSAMENAKNDKKFLKDLREDARSRVAEIEAIDNDTKRSAATNRLFTHITDQMKSYLAQIYRHSEEILRKAPCDYAIFGLGSMALGQMTPYSDLEFGILVTNIDEQTKKYFRALTHLVHLRIINLGETVINKKDIDGALIYDLINRGVNFDLGGKTPIATLNKLELIATIDEMVSYVKNTDNDKNWIDTSNILDATVFVYGKLDLYNQFEKEVNEFLFQTKNAESIFHCEERALKKLKEGIKENKIGNLEEFKPKLIDKHISGKLFDAKQEIYRLPDRLMSSLTLLYKIKPQSVWQDVDALMLKKVINEQAAMNLNNAISFATLLRLKAYLYYNKQREDLHIDYGQKKDQTCFYIFKEEEKLFKFYYTIIPLYNKLRMLRDSLDNKLILLQGDNLFEDSDAIRGYIYYRVMDYNNAKIYLEKTNSEGIHIEIKGPEGSFATIVHVEIKNLLSLVYYELGNFAQALQILEEALQILRINNQDYDQQVAISLSIIASIYSAQSEYEKAVIYYVKAITIFKAIQVNDCPKISQCIREIAAIYYQQGKYEKSLKVYKSALSMIKETIYYHEYPQILVILNNIAAIYSAQGKNKTALTFYHKSLLLAERIYGHYHPHIAANLNNIAVIYRTQGKYKEALINYQESLHIIQTTCGHDHPNVATCLNNIAKVYGDFGKHEEALANDLKALQISECMDNTDLLNGAINSEKVAEIYRTQGKYEEALSHYQKALQIFKDIYGYNHMCVVISLHNIAVVYGAQGKLKEALKKLHEASKIREKINSNKMPDVVILTEKIFKLKSGYLKKTIEKLNSTLKFCSEKEIQKKVSINHNLGCYYHALAELNNQPGMIELYHDNIKSAIESFEQAIALSENKINTGLYSEYANFLIQTQKFEEAIAYLEQVITHTTSSSNGLSYEQMDKNTLDENLQKEIDFYDEITITDPIVFAYYLLIKVQNQLGNVDQIYKIVEQFKDYIVDNTDPLTYSLLGYSYKILEKYEEAVAAFKQAVNLYQATEDRPEYHLAIENQAICMSLSAIITQSNEEYTTQEALINPEIRHMVTFYNNPILREGSLLYEAGLIGGVVAINKLIDSGEDYELAMILIEATKEYGIKHVLTTIFNIKTDDKTTNIAIPTNNLDSGIMSKPYLVFAESWKELEAALNKNKVFNHFNNLLNKAYYLNNAFVDYLEETRYKLGLNFLNADDVLSQIEYLMTNPQLTMHLGILHKYTGELNKFMSNFQDLPDETIPQKNVLDLSNEELDYISLFFVDSKLKDTVINFKAAREVFGDIKKFKENLLKQVVNHKIQCTLHRFMYSLKTVDVATDLAKYIIQPSNSNAILLAHDALVLSSYTSPNKYVSLATLMTAIPSVWSDLQQEQYISAGVKIMHRLSHFALRAKDVLGIYAMPMHFGFNGITIAYDLCNQRYYEAAIQVSGMIMFSIAPALTSAAYAITYTTQNVYGSYQLHQVFIEELQTNFVKLFNNIIEAGLKYDDIIESFQQALFENQLPTNKETNKVELCAVWNEFLIDAFEDELSEVVDNELIIHNIINDSSKTHEWIIKDSIEYRQFGLYYNLHKLDPNKDKQTFGQILLDQFVYIEKKNLNLLIFKTINSENCKLHGYIIDNNGNLFDYGYAESDNLTICGEHIIEPNHS